VPDRGSSGLLQAGRRAWAVLGLALVAALAFVLLARVSVVAIALLLALFPAALLWPAARWLREHRVPAGLASFLLVAGLLSGLALTVRLLVPVVADEVPTLVDAVERGVERLDTLIADGAVPIEADSLRGALDRAVEGVDSSELTGRGVSAATSLVHFATGLLVLLIALFFYLRDGPRLWAALRVVAPQRHRSAVQAIAERVWWTLGAYLRGQLLVALFDAVFIGLGLFLLGVPLALPLAVIVFLGGLFPIVGAFVSGLLAVLVAFADDGLGTAALVLGLVVLVQQVESNLLEPLILSKVIALHPLVVLSTITAGALAFGVLGAFLAVPLTASVARAVDYLRGRTPETGAGSGADSGAGAPSP
jgi:predicted PurR-regulated permease PerM